MTSSMLQDRILATVLLGCRVGEQWRKDSSGGSRLHARPHERVRHAGGDQRKGARFAGITAALIGRRVAPPDLHF